jgi:ATP-dependent Clp protease, protease subunit
MELPSKRTCYAIFTGPIDSAAVQRITNALTELTDPRVAPESIHLFLHSPGGDVPEGIALHNFFRAFPLRLVLYNCGAVDSAAALAFLGAKERRASTHATFAIHKCAMSIAYPWPASQMQECVNALLIQDKRAEAIYRETGLGLTETHWNELANNKTLIFSAKEAVEIGFAQEIAEFSPPGGAIWCPL